MATTYNHFPQIANALDDVLGQVVRKTAFDLQANMQAQIRANHQIDTGFMINSVYVRTSEQSTYSASGDPMKKGQTKLPEVEAPPDKHTAFVAVAAGYGYWQNYGTSRIPARPFLEPSIATTMPAFEEALARVDEKIKGSIS
jgi:hypothetical protein